MNLAGTSRPLQRTGDSEDSQCFDKLDEKSGCAGVPAAAPSACPASCRSRHPRLQARVCGRVACALPWQQSTSNGTGHERPASRWKSGSNKMGEVTMGPFSFYLAQFFVWREVKPHHNLDGFHCHHSIGLVQQQTEPTVVMLAFLSFVC